MESFYDYQFVDFDHRSVILADINKQEYGGEPRPYYVDINYKCSVCKANFQFTAKEQKAWYEEYGFWNRACPINCIDCRKKVRDEKNLLKEFSTYKKENDSDLSPEQAEHISQLMIAIYKKPFSLKLQERFNYLVKKTKL